MLRISKIADYAVIVIAAIAKTTSASYTGQQLADSTHIALPTVRKVLKLLANADLLTSTRGVNGGYALARPAQSITLIDVITAIDGPIAITECCHTEKDCDRQACCTARSNWQTINHAIHTILKSVTIDQMNGALSLQPGQLPWQVRVVHSTEDTV